MSARQGHTLECSQSHGCQLAHIRSRTLRIKGIDREIRLCDIWSANTNYLSRAGKGISELLVPDEHDLVVILRNQ